MHALALRSDDLGALARSPRSATLIVSRVCRPPSAQPDAAEPAAEPAVEIEKAEVQPRRRRDGHAFAALGDGAFSKSLSRHSGLLRTLRASRRGLAIGSRPPGATCATDEKVRHERKAKERTYSDEEIERAPDADLPHWYLENGWIRRKYKTHSWKGTLMVINTVGHLAEAAWHHPDITASYAWVEVRLQNHAAKGITDKDFELAKKIEDVVHWQPGQEGGALEGTPEKDQRFAYIKYDA